MTRQHKLLVLGILGLLPTFACFSPSEGDRTTTGVCPTGETCSTTTAGLFFTGSLDFGDGTHHIGAVTVGGTERVGLLVGDALETATPFTMPITAVSDTPTVLVVDATATGTITVRGVTEGEAFLRVLEPDTGNLIDRVQVQVFASEGPQLHAVALDDVSGQSSFIGGGFLDDFAVLAGTTNELGVTLDGGRTNTGVDRGLRVTNAAGDALLTGDALAPYHFTLAPSGSALIALTLHGAGIDQHASVPVVAAIDGVHIESIENTNFDGTHRLRVCAYGTSSGIAVLGARAPHFDLGEGARETTGSTTHCAELTIASGVSATITAEIDGLEAATTVTGR